MGIGGRQHQAFARASAKRVPSSRNKFDRSRPFVAWLALIGLLLPFELAIFIGTAKFTPGRMAISLLLLPAVVMMCRKGRHVLLSDLFAALTAVWIIYAGSATSVPSSVAEALEFFGGYIVARGYFFERLALESFVRVLKFVTIALVVLGLADTLSGQFLSHNVIAKLVGVEPP